MVVVRTLYLENGRWKVFEKQNLVPNSTPSLENKSHCSRPLRRFFAATDAWCSVVFSQTRLESVHEYCPGANDRTVLVGSWKGSSSSRRKVELERVLGFAAHYRLPHFEVDSTANPNTVDTVLDNVVRLVLTEANENRQLSDSIKPQGTRLAPHKTEFKCSACCHSWTLASSRPLPSI